MKRSYILAIVGVLICAGILAAVGPKFLQKGTNQAPVLSGSLKDDFAGIVARYRKIIVLLEEEESLSAQQRRDATSIGWQLFNQNGDSLDALSELLAANVKKSEADGFSSRPQIVEDFLTELETGKDLRDADKLVFIEIIDHLVDVMRATPGAQKTKKELQARLDDDLRALLEIKALYDKELDKIFGRFETRGMVVHREKWEDYISYLKTKYRREDILKEYEALLPKTVEVEPRPGRNVISGVELPEKTVVLTFDDGPHPKYTDRILEILNKYKVKAVFFEVGKNLGTFTESSELKPSRLTAVTQRLIDAGEGIANHSFTHANLPKLSKEEIIGEIEKTNQAINKVTNTETLLFRPPYGAQNQELLDALQNHKMRSVLWNVDSLDWADPVPKSIANRVIKELSKQKKGILLFHDIHERTIEALPLILDSLKNEGYTFLAWNGKDFVNENRGAPAMTASSGGSFYRENWAVVIGIDQYRNWPKLNYAVNDAKAIRDTLIRKYRFKAENVYLLTNEQATRERIMSVLGDVMGNPEKVRKEDRVFVFFAGHGSTRKLPSGRDLGYIIPVDADLQNFQGQAISMTNFQDISEEIPAKHILFVMDSCYSGLGLTRGGPRNDNFIKEISRRTARQMLTAGGMDEQVADNGPNGHSIFTWTLLQGLEGKADLNGDGLITASELAAYVGPSVSALSHQTPAFGSLPGSEGGEFIFDPRQDNEFLSELSGQLDNEAIQLNAQLDQVRREIAEKSARNRKLRVELASAQVQLSGKQSRTRTQLQVIKHMDTGNAFFKEKKYQEALAEFMAASKLSASNALAANNVGYMYFKMEQYDEAAKWFEKTIAIDPHRSIAYANLGETYLKLNRKDDAKTAMARYLEFAPSTKYADEIRGKMAAIR